MRQLDKDFAQGNIETLVYRAEQSARMGDRGPAVDAPVVIRLPRRLIQEEPLVKLIRWSGTSSFEPIIRLHVPVARREARAGPQVRMPWMVAAAIASAVGALSPAGPPGSGAAPRPIAAAREPRVSSHT
jgi:hypothetical protein